MLALVVALTIVFGSNPTAWALGQGEPERRLSEDQPAAYVRGELLVKFTADVAGTIEEARGGDQFPLVGIGSLDALFAKYGVSAIEPVFPLTHDLEAIKAKFPERTRRIPPGARTPDLSRIYTLRLSPEVDELEAAAALSADPHVEYAHPNYLATTQGHQAPAPY